MFEFSLLLCFLLGFLLAYLFLYRSVHSAKSIEKEHQYTDKIALLSKTRETLLSLFEKGDAVLFRWKNDKDWSVEYVSSNVKSLLGYSKEEFLTQSISYAGCIKDEDLSHVFQEVKHAQEKRLDFFRHEPYRIITRDKEEKWILDYTITQKDEMGEITHFIGYLLDITTMKNYEQELKKARDLADKANRAKSEFLANISHEVRTPLAGIIGLNHLLSNSELSSSQKELVKKMDISSNILLNIINDILDFSKLEAKKFTLHNKPFNFKEVLLNIYGLFEIQANQKNINFTLQQDSNIPEMLVGDSLRLAQILNNLIGNSIKFTKDGAVELSTNLVKTDESCIEIQIIIKDSGIGISQEQQQKLFQPFEQGDHSNTKEFKGTGLGLMISKSLIELMGGTISFTSNQDKGTIFSLIIPFEIDKKDPIVSRRSLVLKEGKKVLLAEDNEINQMVFEDILTHIGFEVHIANNGKEALLKVTESEFDIILMDIQMPVMDGIEATKKIREFNKDIPIIAISAAVLDEDIEKTKLVGVNHHLAKPLHVEKFMTILQSYFEFIPKSKQKPSTQENSHLSLDFANFTKVLETLNFNNQKAYQLYASFFEKYSNSDIEIYNLSDEEFKKYIHNLKGLSGNLAMEELHKTVMLIHNTKVSTDSKNLIVQILKSTCKEIEVKILPLIKIDSSILSKDDFTKLVQKVFYAIQNYELIPSSDIDKIVINLEYQNFSQNFISEIKRLYQMKDLDSLEKLFKEKILKKKFPCNTNATIFTYNLKQ